MCCEHLHCHNKDQLQLLSYFTFYTVCQCFSKHIIVIVGVLQLLCYIEYKKLTGDTFSVTVKVNKQQQHSFSFRSHNFILKANFFTFIRQFQGGDFDRNTSSCSWKEAHSYSFSITLHYLVVEEIQQREKKETHTVYLLCVLVQYISLHHVVIMCSW